MDARVQRLGDVVIDALREAGYMQSTIGQYEKTIKYLKGFVADRGGVYTPALGAEFAAMTTSPRTGRFSPQRRFDYGRLVTLFDGYLRTGRVDLSTRTRGGGGPWPVSDAFTALDTAWEADMDERDLAPATRSAYGRVARGYLTFLESCGVDDLAAADGASVLAFLQSLSGRWATSSLFWVVSNFRPFLKFTGRIDLVEAVGLAGVKRSHPILPVLDDEDLARVVHACTTRMVCARDAAITLLALTTGLRACDLVALRLGDIDWRASTLGIIQQKTGKSAGPSTACAGERHARRVRPARATELGRQACVPARQGAAHEAGRPRLDLPGDRGHVPGRRGDRHQGRDPVVAAQCRLPAAARGGPAADDLGGPGARRPGVDQRVPEHRRGTAARVRAGGPGRSTAMTTIMNGSHGFVSVFGPQLEAYLGFKQAMGCYGASRVWYLRQFDSYCARHEATAFDRGTVEGWVLEQLGRSSRYRSWMSYIRDLGRWMQAHGDTDAYVLSDRWKAGVVPAHPYLLTHERSTRSSPPPPTLTRRLRGGGRRPRSSR